MKSLRIAVEDKRPDSKRPLHIFTLAECNSCKGAACVETIKLQETKLSCPSCHTGTLLMVVMEDEEWKVVGHGVRDYGDAKGDA